LERVKGIEPSSVAWQATALSGADGQRDEIVQCAGVAKWSFYNHFPDKEILAATVSNLILVEVEERVRKANKNVAG
jgi:hypothetical protein